MQHRQLAQELFLSLLTIVGLPWAAQSATGQAALETSGRTRGDVTALAFSPDGAKLAVGWTNGIAILWDARTREPVRTFHARFDVVSRVVFSPDGKTLAVASGYAGKKEIMFAGCPPSLTTRETPPSAEIRLWQLLTGTEKARLAIDGDVPGSIQFAGDGPRLIVAWLKGGVKSWDPASGRERQLFKGAEALVTWSADEQCFAWGTERGEIKVVSRASGKEWSARHAPSVCSLAFSPDGTILAAGGVDLKVWDAATGGEVAFLRGHRGGVFALAFSADGSMLASASGIWKAGKFLGGEIRIWDMKTHKHLATLEGHKDAVYAVAFSPDGRTLASGSADGTVLLWKMPPPKADQDH